MTPNDELAAILARVILEPEEDTNRLVYADRLEERGEPGDAERAEFIRAQVKLAQTPRQRLWDDGTGRVLHTSAGGPDYCEFTAVGREEETLKPGDRVDFPKHVFEKPVRWISGLRVVKVVHAEYKGDPSTVIACRDDVSREIVALCKRETELCKMGVANWAKTLPNHHTISWEWDRGWYKYLTITAEDWLKHADGIVWHPDQTVKCPECKGRGSILDPWKDATFTCYACEKGHVKLTLPPLTAHPIRVVKFTTEPRDTGNLNAFALYKKMEKGEPWRSYRWPGIEFEMPS